MDKTTSLLPVTAILASIAGYYFSPEVAQLKPALMPIIALVMFTMGLTLTLEDFIEAVQQPLPLILGIVLQFLMMPLIAWLLSLAIGLSPELMVGMILVGTAPGGTASNVLTYLAGGRVALSIGMTICSTLLAILMTPLITGFYLDSIVEVDRMGILMSIARMILIPVVASMLLRSELPGLVKRIQHLLPGFAVISIPVALCIIVALNAGSLSSISYTLVLAVLLHNILGLFSGYSLARLFGQSKSTARTIAIEVGTQNSGMAAALAIKHFTVVAGIPGAMFSVLQNVMGALVANYWHKKKISENTLDP